MVTMELKNTSQEAISRRRWAMQEFFPDSIARPIPIEGRDRVNGTHPAVVETQEDLDVMLAPTPLDRPFQALMELKQWGEFRIAPSCTNAVAIVPEVMDQAPTKVLLAMIPGTFYDLPPSRTSREITPEPSQWRYTVRNWDARGYDGPRSITTHELDQAGYKYKVYKKFDEVKVFTGKGRNKSA